MAASTVCRVQCQWPRVVAFVLVLPITFSSVACYYVDYPSVIVHSNVSGSNLLHLTTMVYWMLDVIPFLIISCDEAAGYQFADFSFSFVSCCFASVTNAISK